MKNTLDFYRLDNGKLGTINFNNMIPVSEINIEIIQINKETDKKYSSLLQEQYAYLKRNKTDIFKISKILYNAYIHKNLNNSIRERCCKFPLLEIKCIEYNNSNENQFA